MYQKIFDNNLVAICKNKFTLTLNKLAHIGMCILQLSKYEAKTEDAYENFSNNKEMFNFCNYWTKSQYDHDSNKLVVAKMKDETGGVEIDYLSD